MMRSDEGSSSRRLLFDRRYGWIYDDWKDPSDEALAGGRGLFCIMPLGRAALHMASQSINLVGSSVVEVIQKPELLSPQALQANLNDQLQKLIDSVRKPDFNLFALKTTKPTPFNSHSGMEIKDAQGSLKS